jgi:malonyl-CoA O-methyltransferase
MLSSSESDLRSGAQSRLAARVETVARQFDHRCGRLGSHDALLRESARRMLDRLDYIRLAPQRILDIGCGLGRSRADLLAHYGTASWTGIELSESLARAGRTEQRRGLGMARLWREMPRWIVADGARLPVAEDSVDLVFSNLMLHWHPAPHLVLPEWKRVLRVGGLLMFSCFGPDTLVELRTAVAAALPRASPMPFVDMHDFGDMMVASGFATPVMDVERLTLTFASATAVLAEVRALGGNPRDDRPAALPSGRQARGLLRALDAQRNAEGRIPLTFEIAYGHAWKPAAPGARVNTVSLERLRERVSRERK